MRFIKHWSITLHARYSCKALDNSQLVIGVPYSRVSSTEQASGLGLDRQAANPAAYCAQRGWALYDGPGYSDAGVSAFGGKNLHDGELSRFLADAKAGLFGTGTVALLIEDLDRFSRAMPLAVLPVLIDELLNAGMTISVMSKGRDISRESIKGNQMELHELLFWLGAAHEFSSRLSRRISHVQEIKRQKIRNGDPVNPNNAPAWISIDTDGRWALNEYAAVIKKIIQLASDGIGCHAIATRLNAEKIPSPGQYRRNLWKMQASQSKLKQYKIVRWSGASVKSVLSTPALIGDRQILTPGSKQAIRDWQEKCALLRRQGVQNSDLPKHPRRTYEKPQKNYYPPLISKQEQSAILLAMRRRKPAASGRPDQIRWVASGISFCKCGEAVGAICSKRRNGNVYYLKCRGRVNGTGCKQPGVRLQDAQAALLTRMTGKSLLMMLEKESGLNSTGKLADAIRAQAISQAKVDQIKASVDAGVEALANETDADALRVLAKRQANQENKLGIALKELQDTEGELQLLQMDSGTKELSIEAQEQIKSLILKFQSKQDNVDDRRMIQRHLDRMRLRVHLDGNKKMLGLQVGTSEVDWQPIDLATTEKVLKRSDPFGWDYFDMSTPLMPKEKIVAVKATRKDNIEARDGEPVESYILEMVRNASGADQNPGNPKQ